MLTVLNTARLKLGRIELNNVGVGPTLTNMLRGSPPRKWRSAPRPSGDGLTETNFVHPLVLVTSELMLLRTAMPTCRLLVRPMSILCSLLKHVLRKFPLGMIPLRTVILRGTATCRHRGMPPHFTLRSVPRTPLWAELPIEKAGLLPKISEIAVREKFICPVTLSTAVT